jgi:two-component system sensor histidine kinase TctE
MVLVMILLVWLGVTWSLQPLERLRKTVLANKGRDLKPLDTSDVPHEVAPLVDAVNQHLASYRELLDQQSQFLADASHQLRTPLAIMLTQAGVALREKDTAQLHATLRAMVTQISRSRRLCEQLLSLAHANESGSPANPSEAPEVVDLNSIARDVVLQYLALAHEKNQDLGWVDAREGFLAAIGGTAVPVLARGPELHEALSNLVHNAIVYTPAGGHITVMAARRTAWHSPKCATTGPALPQARRAQVFERFHSADPGAEKSHRGAGLGLGIARAYARRNGGDIELADAASGTGLRAILRLPLAAPSNYSLSPGLNAPRHSKARDEWAETPGGQAPFRAVCGPCSGAGACAAPFRPSTPC